jgi:FKBP-type peptidyl-prolyl cis-trans isomerase FkpA
MEWFDVTSVLQRVEKRKFGPNRACLVVLDSLWSLKTMESRSLSRRGRKFIAQTPLIAGLGIVLVLAAGCGSRPDDVTWQFYERLVALDVDAMSEHVCEDERSDFRGAVGFLESFSNTRAFHLEEFKARTEKSDGTSVSLRVGARVGDGQSGDFPLSGRVRLTRAGGEWCITGERDGFRSIQETAEAIFIGAARARSADGSFFAESFGGSTAKIPERQTEGPAPIQGDGMTTASGLGYVEIETGSGVMPEPGQTVRVHYAMWLKASGEQMDTSIGGKPFEFVLGGGYVVDGFDEGVATMREGGRRRLIVPPKLGYGDDDDYGDIPPNSTLIFDVELVEVR